MAAMVCEIAAELRRSLARPELCATRARCPPANTSRKTPSIVTITTPNISVPSEVGGAALAAGSTLSSFKTALIASAARVRPIITSIPRRFSSTPAAIIGIENTATNRGLLVKAYANEVPTNISMMNNRLATMLAPRLMRKSTTAKPIRSTVKMPR